MIRLIEITDKTYRKGTGTMKENISSNLEMTLLYPKRTKKHSFKISEKRRYMSSNIIIIQITD